MHCLYLLEMILQLQISQSFFLSMLNVILIFWKALWWIEILALFWIFDEKFVKFRWLNDVFLLLIILKWMIKMKLWIRLLRIIWEHIFQKIKQYKQSCSFLCNLFIITVIIILLKWVWTDFYMNSIARFALTLWTMSLKEEYQLQKIALKSFTNYIRNYVYN